jgi:hypothetical protein
MEKITTSLELSKELKENGFKQDSIFAWYKVNGKYHNSYYRHHEKDDICSPTAEELLEELPEMIEDDVVYFLTMRKDRVSYRSLNNNILGTGQIYYESKLCNALAKMWIYLKKNNLLEGK